MEDREFPLNSLLTPLPPTPNQEVLRLRALHELAILDTSPDPSFDRLTQLAALIFRTPIALVVFVDEARQWFKSKHGPVAATESPRATAFCAHTILGNEAMIVLDAASDDRFRSNPFVCTTPGVRFYAGAPIRSLSGHNVGSLCILDTEPRDSFTTEQLQMLTTMAELASEAAESHRRNMELATEGSRTKSRLSLVIRATCDGIWDWDLLADTVYYSPRWQQLLGLPDQDCESDIQYWMDRIHPEDRERVSDELQQHLDGLTPRFLSEHRLRHGDASWRWVIVRGLAQRSAEGKALRMAGSLMDVTKDRTVDSLTGLPNRLKFMEHLARLIARSQLARLWNFAVLFVDIDHFNQINNRFGHLGGDAVLKVIAERLVECLASTRANAQSLVARFAGDEFILLLDGVDNSSQAYGIAQRFHAEVNKPVQYGDESLQVGISIGIAMARPELQTAESFLDRSDLALKRAKTSGRATSVVFNPSMQQESSTRMELEDGLRRAIETDELRLHFQPQLNLSTGKLAGCEALVRWQHPKLDLLAPGIFIGIAEEIGLISQLDSWVLRNACMQLARWRALPDGAGLRMSVNLSSHSLTQRKLISEVETLIAQCKIPANALCFELTESVLMKDIESCTRLLHRLRAIGVGLHMDDFGSGYSSFRYLSELPFDTLKIDRSFMQKFPSDRKATEVVQGILALAHTMDLRVIAEGVEQHAQAEALTKMKCDVAQGYFFDRPLPPTEFVQRYLHTSHSLSTASSKN